MPLLLEDTTSGMKVQMPPNGSIGRHVTNTLTLERGGVSGKHCTFTQSASGVWRVTDSSSHGTSVSPAGGGDPVQLTKGESHVLTHGCHVALNKTTRFLVHISDGLGVDEEDFEDTQPEAPGEAPDPPMDSVASAITSVDA